MVRNIEKKISNYLRLNDPRYKDKENLSKVKDALAPKTSDLYM